MTVLWDLRVEMLFPSVLYHDKKEKKKEEKKPSDHFKFISIGLFLYSLIIHGEILGVNGFCRGWWGWSIKCERKGTIYAKHGEYFNTSFLCMT